MQYPTEADIQSAQALVAQLNRTLETLDERDVRLYFADATDSDPFAGHESCEIYSPYPNREDQEAYEALQQRSVSREL